MRQPQQIPNLLDNTSIYYGWINVGCSVLGNFMAFGAVVVFTFSTFIVPITAEFGWSRGQISGALTLAHIVLILCLPALGILVDRHGIRAVLIPSTAAFGAALCTLYLVADSVVVFYCVFALLALAGTGTLPITYSKLIVDWFDENRGLSLGLGLSGIGLGAFFLPRICQVIIENQGWREAYLTLGLIVLIIVLPLLYLFVREREAGQVQSGSDSLPGYSFQEAIKTPAFVKFLVVCFLVGLGIMAALSHYVPLLIDSGIAPPRAVSIVSMVGLSLIVGRILAGYLMDRFFAPHIAAIFFMAPVIGFALLGFNVSPAIAVVGALMIGAALGAEFDVIAFFVSRYFGLKAFGKLYSVFFAVFSIGSGIGPLAMGLAHDFTGSYSMGLMVSSVVMFASVVMLLVLGPYPKFEHKEAGLGQSEAS